MSKKTFEKSQEGSLLVTVMVIMMFLMIMLLSLMLLAQINLGRARERILTLQTQYTAETGADIALSRLNTGNLTAFAYGSEVEIVKSDNAYRATYQMKMEDGATGNEKIITAIGRVYTPANAASARYTRTVRVTAKRTSSAVANSIVSRNIIHVASSVKDVWAKDLFVNEYIQLDKNTTQLIAESITVAGKNTSASNCSIAGSGKLAKPTTFTDASQTKTILNLAYNNCISPPGNTSNADFTVNPNQTNIQKVQSTYIPWNYTMGGASYVAAPGGCNDWTSGATRTIPSAGNANKTHYPDSGSGIIASCGTSGTIDLGTSTVTINDHAHVRANICSSSSPCAPTFNNPTGSLKFVFVEGTVAFGAVKTTTGSAPIAIVAYGGDPASLSGVCPLGGAAYLGPTSSDQVNAPDLYLIAVNGGFCAEKTKFGASKSLGGVSGKNVYLATNSGTPFDLSFDPSFPLNQIPVNLSWKATQYERIQ